MTYEDAVKVVRRVHDERKVTYGMDWEGDEAWMQLAFIKMKVRRLQRFIIDGKGDQNFDRRMDCVVDLVNYGLFLISNDLRRKEAQRGKRKRGKEMVQGRRRES